MSMSRNSRVVCLHAAEFGLERGLVSVSLLKSSEEKYIGTEAGKWVHVVVQARLQTEGEDEKRVIKTGSGALLFFTKSLVRK